MERKKEGIRITGLLLAAAVAAGPAFAGCDEGDPTCLPPPCPECETAPATSEGPVSTKGGAPLERAAPAGRPLESREGPDWRAAVGFLAGIALRRAAFTW